jgi:hypothetical protein
MALLLGISLGFLNNALTKKLSGGSTASPLEHFRSERKKKSKTSDPSLANQRQSNIPNTLLKTSRLNNIAPVGDTSSTTMSPLLQPNPSALVLNPWSNTSFAPNMMQIMLAPITPTSAAMMASRSSFAPTQATYFTPYSPQLATA